jgi:FkbM family methyltransferase
MTKPLKAMIRKVFLGKEQNLVSLDDPYERMGSLLRGHDVTQVVDAGASNGRISKKLLRLFPQATVYGFEPNPLYGGDLARLHKMEHRFEPQFVALSDEKGLVDMHLTASPGSSSLFVPSDLLQELDPEGASVTETRTIGSVTLDQWAHEQQVDGVQVLKLDIQGGELKAFRGASDILRSSTLLIYTEVLFNPIYTDGPLYGEIDLYLREHGFVLHDMFKPKYDPKGTLLWGNALYLHPNRMSF